MKGKSIVYERHFFQSTLHSRCWALSQPGKVYVFKRLFIRYQSEIESILASLAIGLMLLIGIWSFLIQLAGA